MILEEPFNKLPEYFQESVIILVRELVLEFEKIDKMRDKDN